MAESQVLRGVWAHVQLTKAAQGSKAIKRCLERELEEMGAKVAGRLSKNCTHVVLQHKTDDPTDEDRAADETSALELTARLEQVRSEQHAVYCATNAAQQQPTSVFTKSTSAATMIRQLGAEPMTLHRLGLDDVTLAPCRWAARP